MKQTLLTMFLLAFTRVFARDDIRFLKAIAQVESGGNPEAVGQMGEVSEYQILPYNWRRYTNRPTWDGNKRGVSLSVAIRHLAWTKAELRRMHPYMAPEDLFSPYMLAIAWRWGPGGTRGTSLQKMEYATRVRNIYGDSALQ